MFTIDKCYQDVQEIKKSKFICYLFPVQNVDEATAYLKEIRSLNSDATHNCYCYIIGKTGEIAKSSDDGEPAKTAGIPIYEILKKNQLTNILAIVTRYFGGIKLGAGGLIRAYSGSVNQLIQKIPLIEIIEMKTIRLEFAYLYLNEILNLCKNYKEVDRDFTTNISLTYEIPTSEYESLSSTLISKTKGQIAISEG